MRISRTKQIKLEGKVMIDKIKALPQRTMIFIGIILVLVAIIFFLVVCFVYEIVSNRWIDFVFYFLFGSGLAFMAMAYKKKLENK